MVLFYTEYDKLDPHNDAVITMKETFSNGKRLKEKFYTFQSETIQTIVFAPNWGWHKENMISGAPLQYTVNLPSVRFWQTTLIRERSELNGSCLTTPTAVRNSAWKKKREITLIQETQIISCKYFDRKSRQCDEIKIEIFSIYDIFPSMIGLFLNYLIYDSNTHLVGKVYL